MAGLVPFTYDPPGTGTPDRMPIIPGAYLLNGATTANGGIGSFPIYGTIPNYPGYCMGGCDDRYILLPGFAINVFNISITNNPTAYATSGTGLIIFANNINASRTTSLALIVNPVPNTGQSCRLYYGGTNPENQIVNVYQ
jgi:hypothetical protein